MQLLFNLHAIAAQRGDGLRPELLRLAKGDQADQNTPPPLNASLPTLKNEAPELTTRDEVLAEQDELGH